MATNLSEYKLLFMQSATSLVHSYDNLLTSLKQDGSSIKQAAELFRIIHTLKGQFFFMNYVQMASLCMKLEELLYPLRDSGGAITQEVLNSLPEARLFFDNLDSIARTDTEIPLAQSLPMISQNQ